MNTLITKSRRVAILAILSLIASMFLAMQATQPANAANASIDFDAGEPYVYGDAGAYPAVVVPPVAQFMFSMNLQLVCTLKMSINC